jgi:uncharacterized protein (DUF2141 family)
MKIVCQIILGTFLLSLSACAGIATSAEQERARKHYAEIRRSSPKHVKNLKVHIKHIPTNAGTIHAGLYDSTLKFPQRFGHLEAQQERVDGDSFMLVFKDVPFGRYAIAAFQDENNDGILNSNFFGIPTEALAFSNRAKAGSFGPPKFEEASFEVKSEVMEIELSF